SGQTVLQATETLRDALRAPARRPVVLRSGGRRAVLPVRRVKYAFDAALTARRALRALPRTRVKPAITFIRTPIRTFVDAFAATVLVPARDAGVRITLRHIYRTEARAGRRVAVKKLNRVIEKALADPRRPRTKRVRPVRTRPAIGARDLKRRYASIITIDRSTFTLRLFKRLRHAKSYSVAVGQPAYPTPTGLFAIQTKQVNPTWTAPNSPWAGEAAGQSFNSSDPGNPLKARWMAVDGSVGIHGTGQDSSIGSAASHGCIRMHVSDVVDLYDRVAVGTPVLIR
ncbi:MAG: L,D-transpeptidase family protein, partial [Solirubrobacteraceae bacterium]